MRLSAIVFLALLAGCVADPTRPQPVREEEDDRAPIGYACLAGGEESTGGACVTRVREEGQAFQEPALAIDPLDASRWAIGVNAIPTTSAVSGTSARVLSVLTVLFTRDAGSTWTSVEVPLPLREMTALGATISYDPTVAFHDGALHVAGVYAHDAPASTTGPLGSTRIFATRTSDDGASWDPVVILGEPGADRPWIVRGPGSLHLVWMQGRDTSVVAELVEGEWHAAGEPLACVFPSTLASNATSATLACTGARVDDATLYALSPGLAPAPFATVELPDPSLLHLVAARGPTLVGILDVLNAQDVAWIRSDDAGATWQKRSILADVPPASAWRTHRVFGVAEDDSGHAHAILVGGPDAARCDPSGGILVRKTPGGCDVVHAAIDWEGRVILWSLLAAADPAEAASSPLTLPLAAAAFTADDYASVVTGPDGVRLAWTGSGEIGLALVTLGNTD